MRLVKRVQALVGRKACERWRAHGGRRAARAGLGKHKEPLGRGGRGGWRWRKRAAQTWCRRPEDRGVDRAIRVDTVHAAVEADAGAANEASAAPNAHTADKTAARRRGRATKRVVLREELL